MYDWTTGALEHTWPAQGATTATSGPNQVGHIEAYGGLVLYSVYSQYVGGDETLHVLDPAELEFPFRRLTEFKGLEDYPGVAADPQIIRGIEQWYKGKVIVIGEARPQTRITDDVIPALLRRLKASHSAADEATTAITSERPKRTGS